MAASWRSHTVIVTVALMFVGTIVLDLVVVVVVVVVAAAAAVVAAGGAQVLRRLQSYGLPKELPHL